MGAGSPGVPILPSSKVYLLKSNKRDEGIKKAAWQLEDALEGRLVDAYPSTPQAREMHFNSAQADHDCMIAMIFMVLLTIAETPSWCDASHANFFNWIDGAQRCVSYEGSPSAHQAHPERVLLSNISYIPPGVGLVVEVWLLAVIAKKLLLSRKLQIEFFAPLDAENKSALKVASFGLVMVAFSVIDIGIFAVNRQPYRLAFIFRTGLLATLPAVQNLGACVFRVIGEFISIAVFLLGTIFFFAWIAVTIFDDLGTEVNGVTPNEGMSTFGETLYTMFVAGTTDEFVDMLLPSYTAFRASGLLWLPFLIIVQVLLLNLVLDTLVAAYTKNSEIKTEEDVEDKVTGIRKAFRTLLNATQIDTTGQTLAKSCFLEFIAEFGRSPRMRSIPLSTAELLVSAIKEQEDEEEEDSVHEDESPETIDEEEFCKICAVIEFDFWTTKKNSPVEEEFPALWNSKVFKFIRAWNEPTWSLREEDNKGKKKKEQKEKKEKKPEWEIGPSKFDGFMTNVLFVNLAMVVYESSFDLNGEDEPGYLANVELIFSFAYVMEVGVKLCVISWPEYTADKSNQFDFFTTWLLLGSSALEEASSMAAGLGLKRYVNILRLLRLIRVLKQLKRQKAVQFMISTISKLVLASTEILTLLGVVVFFFTTLSVQLWGGLLYKECTALDESEYNEKNYHVLNFNDFPLAFGAWVVILLCEYVPIFADAIYRTADGGSPHADFAGYPVRTWTVFLIFYFVGVCIVFELVKAFTIEVFLELKKTWEETGGNESGTFSGLDAVKKRVEEGGQMLHYREGGDSTKREKFLEKLEEEMKEMKEEEEEHEHARHEAAAQAGGEGHGGHGGH